MDREQFLKALVKEGLVIYGTTYESNFKRLQELKKYKEMWEVLEEEQGWAMHYADDKVHNIFLKDVMGKYKREYFPSQKTVLTLEIESQYKECIADNLKEIYSFINSANDRAVKGFHGHITLTGIKDV